MLLDTNIANNNTNTLSSPRGTLLADGGSPETKLDGKANRLKLDLQKNNDSSGENIQQEIHLFEDSIESSARATMRNVN